MVIKLTPNCCKYNGFFLKGSEYSFVSSRIRVCLSTAGKGSAIIDSNALLTGCVAEVFSCSPTQELICSASSRSSKWHSGMQICNACWTSSGLAVLCKETVYMCLNILYFQEFCRSSIANVNSEIGVRELRLFVNLEHPNQEPVTKNILCFFHLQMMLATACF